MNGGSPPAEKDNVMSDNENKPPRQEDNPAGKSKRPAGVPSPKAALIWLLILLAIGGMLLFRRSSPAEVRNISQSEFETLLAAKRVVSAEFTGDSDRIYDVEGKLAPAAGTSATQSYRTKVIYSSRLSELLSNTEVKVKSNNAGFWHIFWVGIAPVLLIGALIYFISMRQIKMSGRGALDFGRSKARMIPPDELNVKFSDIAGADEAKEEITELVEYLKDPIRFQLVGGKIPRGCLLVGEPGTGKTLMAKAVACEAGVPFFSISGSDFVEMFVGVGASRVRDMFEQARKHTPCLIFIDEIDAVGRSRFSGWGGGHDEREQTLNAMLVEMDGLESRAGVIVLAATNRPDVLDPALLRPGRFDRQVVMDLPDINGRRQILDVHIKKIKTDGKVDLDVIARTTPGFSGADLANLCNEAALLAARRNLECVSQKELEEARDKVSYGAERKSRKITERERRLTAWHEAGHALVALYNEHCTPLHKVTIIPRGNAYLGATFTMPKEDVYTKTKLELEAEMSMAMGGRAAEEIVFGDITTGASADIQHLTAIARHMVCVYGMSEKLGTVKVGDFSIHPHLRIDGPQPDQLAPETAREIDLEVRRLVNTALDAARECLRTHKDQLDKLAEALLERETLSIDEIKVLLGMTPPEPPPAETADETPEPAAEAAGGSTPEADNADGPADDETRSDGV